MKARTIAALLLLSLPGCRLWREFAFMGAPEVLSFSPDRETVEAAELSGIEVVFNQPMDHLKTEQAFSLYEDEEKLAGVFGWEGATLRFLPFGGFREKRRYEVSISTLAEDPFGNSLARELHFVFLTKAESVRPLIVSHSPADGEEGCGLQEPVVIAFSEPMDPGSLRACFSITPQLEGVFRFSADSTVLTFSPLQPYEPGTEYRVALSTEAADASGNRLAEQFSFRFTAGAREELELQSLTLSGFGLALQSVEYVSYNSGIEKDDRLVLAFNASVPLGRQDAILKISPAAPFVLDWAEDFRSCLVRFEEYLQANRVYELEILEECYRLRIDGPRSQPPQVSRITFCNDTEALPSPVFVELTLNATVTMSASPRSCFDFYIRHAAGSGIDTGAFLSAVSFASTAVSFLYRRVENPAGTPPPEPAPAPQETVVRLAGEIMDRLESGLITITVESELKDSFDNALASDYVLQVNRP